MVTMIQPAMDAPVQAAAEPPLAGPREPHVSASAEFYRPERVTFAIKIAVGVVTPMIGFLAVLGGIGSFSAVRHLAFPWFGHSAWIVPVGIDVGILVLLSWDLIAEYLGLPLPILRWTAWAFISATVYLNVAAAHGDLTAAVMHAAMPALFVTVTEGIRHLIRQLTGLAAGTRIERIPAPRWIYAPIPTLLLKRRMVLWQVTSYRLALSLEHRRLQAVARLQESYGRCAWHWKAPLADRLALRLASAGMPLDTPGLCVNSAAEEQDVVPDRPKQPSTAALAHFLPQQCLIEPPKAPEPTHGADRALIDAATEILHEAEGQISQVALARKLRERGHRVANERLRWLVNAVQRASLHNEAP